MEVYLLKSGLCLAVFLAFYKLFLEQEQMHLFKRFYLLSATVLSFSIPLLYFTTYVTIDPSITSPTDFNGVVSSNISEIYEHSPNWLSIVLWVIYGIGVALFGLKFIRNLFQIRHTVKANPKYKLNTFTTVLLSDPIHPHTFFNFIFLNKERFEKKQIPQEVIWHEEAHAIQKHSVDILCVEVLLVFFWFNPLFYVLRQTIKLNHEFLADEAVIQRGIARTSYQQLLLKFVSTSYHGRAINSSMVSNAINYSSIKKRFTVMKTQTSKQKNRMVGFVLIPLVALLMYGFSNKITQYEIAKEPTNTEITLPVLQPNTAAQRLNIYNNLAKKYNAQPIEHRRIPSQDLQQLEYLYHQLNSEEKKKAQPFPECLPKNIQKGASREEMKEYNTLAKKYNEMSPDNMRIYLKDVERLKYVYSLMSDKQKVDAEPLPNFPPPPPPIGNTAKQNDYLLKGISYPAPLPDNATPQQKRKHAKAVENYKTQGYGYTYLDDGNEVTVIISDVAPPPPPVVKRPPPPPRKKTKN